MLLISDYTAVDEWLPLLINRYQKVLWAIGNHDTNRKIHLSKSAISAIKDVSAQPESEDRN